MGGGDAKKIKEKLKNSYIEIMHKYFSLMYTIITF